MRQVTVTEKYRAVLEGNMAKGEFVRQMRLAHPQHITQFNGFDDSVQILKNRGLLFEIKKEEIAEAKEAEYAEDCLPYSDEAFQRGIRHELQSKGIEVHAGANIKLEDYDTAKAAADKNLSNDPMHYLNLLSGESSKVDKHDKPVETKRGAKDVDTFNGLKKADLRENKAELAKLLKEGKLEALADKLGVPVERLKGAADKLREMEREDAAETAGKVQAMKDIIGEEPDEVMNIDRFGKEKEDKDSNYTKIKEAAFKVTKEFDTADDFSDDGRAYVQVQDNGKGGSFIIDPNQQEYTPGTLTILEVLEDQGYTWDNPDAYFSDIESMQALKDKDEAEDLINGFGTDYVDELELHKSWEDAMFPRDEESPFMEGEGSIDQHEHEFFSIIFDKKYDDILDDYMSSETFKQDEKHLQAETGQANVFDYAYKDQWEHYIKEFEAINRDDVDEDLYEQGKETNFDPKEIKSVSFPNGLEVTVGEPHPEEEGVVNFIRKGQNGYEIGFMDGSEGAAYSVDFNGEYLEEDDYIEEKKGKDHDGDGDVDGDDYKAAKDKAIKKAMGKDDKKNEQLKEAIKKIIKSSLLKEAATAKLSDIGDKYGDYKGMQVVINDLENIVTDMEGYFAKTRDRVQNAMDKIGQVETPDGMKVGAFLAPAIETAFFKDLNPVRKLSHRDIKLPQVKIARFDDLQREAEAEIAPKETVFGINEKK